MQADGLARQGMKLRRALRCSRPATHSSIPVMLLCRMTPSHYGCAALMGQTAYERARRCLFHGSACFIKNQHASKRACTTRHETAPDFRSAPVRLPIVRFPLCFLRRRAPSRYGCASLMHDSAYVQARRRVMHGYACFIKNNDASRPGRLALQRMILRTTPALLPSYYP